MDPLAQIRKQAAAIVASHSRSADELTAPFLKAIAFILPHEESFARGHWGDENFVVTENVSGDSGGLTKYGIDASSHPGIDIKNLTRAGAIEIYWHEWLKHNLDFLPEKLAIAMFDVWVNGGHAVAWLQAAVNLVRQSSRLAVDGVMGDGTLAAVHALGPDGEAAVVEHFIQERDARFESIARNNPQDRQFLDGWEQRDRDLEKFLAV